MEVRMARKVRNWAYLVYRDAEPLMRFTLMDAEGDKTQEGVSAEE